MFARRRNSAVDVAYLRSKADEGLPVEPTAVARGLALRVLDVGDDARERRRLGQMLLDELSAAAGLIRVELLVPDRAQIHEHDGRRLQSRTYGYYRCWFENGEVSRGRIRIYHRTAVRQQVISAKVFLNTLLHEWNHHFDFAGLRLPRSPHTSGFYARLRALADALDVGMVLPPERDADGNPIPREARAASTHVIRRERPGHHSRVACAPSWQNAGDGSPVRSSTTSTSCCCACCTATRGCRRERSPARSACRRTP